MNWLSLTAFDGKPILIAPSHVVTVAAQNWRDDRLHQNLDPDCTCHLCRDCWSVTCITLDLEETCEEHGTSWMEVRVRESVAEIAQMLGAAQRMPRYQRGGVVRMEARS